MMSVLLVALFYLLFTLFKFDAYKIDLLHTFLGTTNKDYINIQWFVAWDLKHLLEGFSGYWNTPFYTPLTHTLGFGDHVLGLSLLSLPAYLVTHSTVFCYNFLFLAMFVLIGVATYLLFYFLTGHKWASLIMGLAFDYCQFRYSILSHTYVLSIYPFIFFLVCAHRFVAGKQERYLALAYLCLIWQLLCGMNMGLSAYYLSFVFFVYYLVFDPMLRTRRTLSWIVLGHTLAGIVFVWLAIPNVMTLHAQELSWRWGDSIRHSSNWGDFLSVAPSSILAAPWMRSFFTEVATVQAFPGFFVLAMLGTALWQWKPKELSIKQENWRAPVAWILILSALIVGVIGVAAFFLPSMKSFYIEKKIELSDWSLVLALAAMFINKKWRATIIDTFRNMPINARFYALLAAGAFLFSFSFFFRILNLCAPGFSSVRVPVRLLEFFELGLCVLGAYGLAVLFKKRSWILVALLPVFVLENIHPRVPTELAPPLPAAHHWIMEHQAEVNGIIELPFPKTIMQYGEQTDYVYWTTYHWTRTVHGFFSIFPRYYHWLSLALADNPVPPVGYLRVLQVSHVVCHWDRLGTETANAIKMTLEQEGFKPVFVSSGSSVYVMPNFAMPRAETTEVLPIGSTVTTSIRSHHAKLAFDDNRKTAWKTGRAQQAGDWIEITLPRTKVISGLVMYLGKNFMDMPRKVKVERKAGTEWVPIMEVNRSYPDTEDFLSIVQTPANPTFTIHWAPISCAVLRLTLLSGADDHWSIAELATIPAS